MDLKEIGGMDGIWTDEMHVSFLNCMEASFVKAMLRTTADRGFSSAAAASPPRNRLDRHLPDSADSTCCPARGGGGKSGVHRAQVRRDSRWRPYNASQDQVVPQFEREEEDQADGRCETRVAVKSGFSTEERA
ncbi:hypothetical protein QJS10_CPA01g02448 [Acorus calamus]|uniref:Uncharacterized protein n=1 Tax=Acorus calamus TaxID=4465 RepID=A0AAV9FG15_ACOCL|nr:hypothetical protein QJS10_CPA01g02448 [Acorus calamus]